LAKRGKVIATPHQAKKAPNAYIQLRLQEMRTQL
jgi:hypothetical protein